MRIRQRLEQNGIHRTEDGRACADAERQRENADERKTRIVEQLTRGIMQIGGERSEQAFPSVGAYLFADNSWIAELQPRSTPRVQSRTSSPSSVSRR